MVKEQSVGAIIFFQNGIRKYLLLKYIDGHWDFVKGKIEFEEDGYDTVLRESQEEAGLSRNDLLFLSGFCEAIEYTYDHDDQTIHKTVTFYLVRSHTVHVSLSSEHIDYVWLPLKDALQHITFDNARLLLHRAARHLDKL